MKWIGIIGAALFIAASFNAVFFYQRNERKHEAKILAYEQELTSKDKEIFFRNKKLRAREEEVKELKDHVKELASLSPILGLLTPNELDGILSILEPATPFDSRTRVTSRFGEGRGYQGSLRNGHLGNDLVPDGEWYVRSMWSGTVVDIGIDHWLGKYIVVQHSENVRTRYAHLETIFYVADVGTNQEPGDLMGIMGSTGNSDGAHLHLALEVFDGEKWVVVDIYPWLAGHGGN